MFLKMRVCLVLAVIIALVRASEKEGGSSKELEDVEKFIQQEIDESHNPAKRSSIQIIPEVTSFHESGKPEKISITVLKEYNAGETNKANARADTGNGEEFSSTLKKLSPAPVVVQESVQVVQEQTPQPPPKEKVEFKIFKAKDLTPVSMRPMVTRRRTRILKLSQPQQQQQHQQQQTPSFPATPVPTKSRKTMDGWIPLASGSYIGPNQRGLAQRYKDFYAQNQFSKGAYYSPYKEGLQQSETASVPQRAEPDFQIQKAVQHGSVDPKGVLIHAQNVIIKANMDREETTLPNLSQIKAYDSTPQISALLRERFRKNQQPETPTGGVSLRSLAQAIRNGAFSLENDIIPSSAPEKPQDIEISIPMKFKMRKSKILTTQGTQATAASYTQGAYAAPTPYSPPRVSPNAFTPGLRDYGDGVKYALKEPIQIVEAFPTDSTAAGYSGYGSKGGASLDRLASELEQKLKELVEQEVLLRTMHLQQQYAAPQTEPQYGVPPPPSPQQSYGTPLAPVVDAAPVQQEYGVPGQEAGQPLEAYGPPGSGPGPEPQGEYGPPPPPPPPAHDHHHEHHHDHHEKPKKPFTLNLNFDSGFWGEPHASVQVDTGDQVPHPHHEGGDHGHGWLPSGPELDHIKEEVKEKLVHLGKNLFYSAIDFSRKYNPITFIEKVKEFPPIRFEVHETPKKGHKKGHKGKRRRKGRHGKGKKHRH